MNIKRDLEVGALTHVGKVRHVNQDKILVKVGEEPHLGDFGLFVVADGMGGLPSGEEASSIAVEELNEWWHEDLADIIGSNQPFSQKMASIEAQLEDKVHLVNERIISFGNAYGKKIGSTLTLVFIYGGEFIIKHIGDSRAYLLDQSTLKQLTLDHSWVGEQVREGKMSREEARKHPKKNILTQCIGIRQDVNVHSTVGKFDKGSAFILCSDGLHNMMDEEEMETALKGSMQEKDPAQELVKEYIDIANQRGGEDNISAIAVWDVE